MLSAYVYTHSLFWEEQLQLLHLLYVVISTCSVIMLALSVRSRKTAAIAASVIPVVLSSVPLFFYHVIYLGLAPLFLILSVTALAQSRTIDGEANVILVLSIPILVFFASLPVYILPKI